MRGLLLSSRLGRPRNHPTPAQAVEALSQGACLYAPISSCSGDPSPVGLRDNEDEGAVLVCKAHFGRLRKLDRRSLDKLERHLVDAFARNRGRVVF
jgi:hypothetical protein